MIRALRISVLAVCFSASAWGQLPSPPPELSVDGAKVDHYPADDVTFPNGVTGIPDVVYSEPIGYRSLTLTSISPRALYQTSRVAPGDDQLGGRLSAVRTRIGRL